MLQSHEAIVLQSHEERVISILNSAVIKGKLVNGYSLSNSRKSSLVAKKVDEFSESWEDLIAARIKSGHPTLFGRLGGLEAHCLGLWLDSKRGITHPLRYLHSKSFKNYRFRQLENNAGVYPRSAKIFDFFCSEQLTSIQAVDIFSVWAQPFAWVESVALQNADCIFVSGYGSFPWLEPRDLKSKVGWGSALEGKKVLVISPFIDSIKFQIPNLDKIFSNLKVPDIEFKFLRAPLTQGGVADGKSYRDHLLRLKDQATEIDFDIALISAGGYSLPIAAHAKNIGKIGIHAGGAMQLFFGINGQRYEQYPEVTRHINSYWKRPFDHERPENWRSIEGGCYW